MSLETVAPTWRHKLLVSDAVTFGGDLAAAAAPASWNTSGAYSKHRACALAAGDYIELDFTFDIRTAGHGIAVGLSSSDPDKTGTNSLVDSCWIWDTDNNLKAYEQGTLRATVNSPTLPLSARIIYNAGVLTFRSNAGVDTLRYTSLRTVAQIYDVMFKGLSVDAAFNNSSGQFHATLKGGTASTPEIPMDGSTGRLGLYSFEPQGVNLESYLAFATRFFEAQGFPTGGIVRPTAGKIWPRKR